MLQAVLEGTQFRTFGRDSIDSAIDIGDTIIGRLSVHNKDVVKTPKAGASIYSNSIFDKSRVVTCTVANEVQWSELATFGFKGQIQASYFVP